MSGMNRQNNSAAELTGEEWSLVVHCIAKEIEAEICRFQQQEMPLIGAAEVTDVRPERLLDISSHDANCEGFTEAGTHPRADFLAAWDQLYGYGAAEADPWVWVIEFKQIEVK